MVNIKQERVRILFEQVDEECEEFLENVNEATPAFMAAQHFSRVLERMAEIAKTAPPDVPAMIEIAHHVVEIEGQKVCARVGVNKEKSLLIAFTPVGCDGQHALSGRGMNLMTLEQLESFGFTPLTMVRHLHHFVWQVLVPQQVTMAGGDA